MLPSRELRRRQQERSIEVAAVHTKEIHLILVVGAADVAARGASRRSEQDDNHVAFSG